MYQDALGEFKADALGAAEAALGLVERCFCVADIKPAVIDPVILARHVRRMMARGESCAHFMPGLGGMLDTMWASGWTITGHEFDPMKWRYKLSLHSPSGNMAHVVSGKDVLHFRHSPDPEHRGRSPLDLAGASMSVAKHAERAVRAALNVPTGVLIPMPQGAGEKVEGDLTARLGKGGGAVHLVETTKGGHGAGMAAAPQSDWAPKHLRPDVAATILEVRKQSRSDVLAALNTPENLLAGGSDAGQRESFRRYTNTTLAGIAAMAAGELTAKTGRPVSISFEKLYASDMAGRARSVGILVGAGADLDEMMEKVGISDASG